MTAKKLFAGLWPLLCLGLLFAALGYACRNVGNERNWSLLISGAYLNESRSVTVVMPDSGLRQFSGEVHLYWDVPAGDSPYVTVVESLQPMNEWAVSRVFVHVHPKQCIEGGGWDHGKLGHGLTSRID